MVKNRTGQCEWGDCNHNAVARVDNIPLAAGISQEAPRYSLIVCARHKRKLENDGICGPTKSGCLEVEDEWNESDDVNKRRDEKCPRKVLSQ